ncbi:hypothetical protein B0A49_05660 [Cryomyces minteri]|uniref:Grh/CP2 DB domain-containing protein n=1 Tax=Cryomyces minteri TaxID=331657 RepID=A0A4U0XFH2_9PEZI|nr:hypothetical protein B0A49_05660 [Cryomyces minteri]
MKDGDPTPRGSNEPWRFTPSLLDPNSFAFTSFANQPPGYYTPTPGGTTIYHSQAGDLHTPGFMMGLGTPLSSSEGMSHTGHPTGAHGFNFYGFHQQQQQQQQQFQNVNPFNFHAHHSFAPHQFSHEPSVFEQHMEQPSVESPVEDTNLAIDMPAHSPAMMFSAEEYDGAMRPPPMQRSAETFRYHVTLNAPTAMVKHSDEIPVTYLNKGQAYSVSIVDTTPEQPAAGSVKYRTFIRISFEDEQQRQRPGACWQLWKEGRGTNEAHQRGGKLQAVEYAEPSKTAAGDDSARPRIELETASFDGFSVTWSPPINGATECSIAVRFNFLSTDFSHSKGVKGIPVRLCAKTELVSSQVPPSPQRLLPEICYCKVKLFRDHGAERKLTNDVAHIKKTIEKLKQQIAQSETGMKDFGKRKRAGSISKGSVNTRPGKVQKHKRTWSISSASSIGGGGRVSAEEDLHAKLATLQDMFTSTRPASVLYLRGAEQDDPDIYPVRLSGEPQDLTKIETNPMDNSMWERQSVQTANTLSIVSPTPSANSILSAGRGDSTFQQPAPYAPPSRVPSNDWQSYSQTAIPELQASSTQQMTSSLDQPSKVQTLSPRTGRPTGWIEALGIDHSYQPPPERVIKPVACVYIQPRIVGRPPEDNYYRAIYLMQRTLKDLVHSVATKCNIEPTQIFRTVRVNRSGVTIFFDDESVRELPEGQDLVAEFTEVQPHAPMKREWDAGPTDIQVDGDVGAVDAGNSAGYELRLLF